MSDTPAGRCGYTWPEDYTLDEDPAQQSCCYRETAPGSDRCAWHTDDEDAKTVDHLKQARETSANRSQNTQFDELLDGAILAGCELEDAISFENTSLRDANLEEADLTGANCFNAVFDEANLEEAILQNAYFSGRFVTFYKGNEEVKEYVPDHPSDSYHSLINSNLGGINLSEAKLTNTDFSGQDLRDADFSGANLTGSDFTDAELRGATFSGAKLDGCIFTDARFGDTDLSRSSIKGADFSDAILDGISTDFSGSNLEEANFEDAKIGKSNFADTDLSEATFGSNEKDPQILTKADFSNATFDATDLSDVYLGGASLSNTDFDDVDLSGVFMNHVDLSEAELNNVNLSGSWLYKADFSGTELTDIVLEVGDNDVDDLSQMRICIAHLEADFDESQNSPDPYIGGFDPSSFEMGEPETLAPTLVRADFTGASLTDVDLSGRDLTGTSFDKAECTNIDFSSVDLQDASLMDADLMCADLSDIVLTDVDLRSADLTSADLTRADLTNAELNGATCRDSVFLNVTLEDAEFHKADLRKATLTGANCENTDFSEANLCRASLTGTDLVGADLTQAYLFGTTVDGARISSQTRLNNGDIGDTNIDDYCRYDIKSDPDGAAESLGLDTEELANYDEAPEIIQLRRGRSTYRRLEQLAKQNGFPELQSDLFVRRQEMARELYRIKGERTRHFLSEIQRIFINYGESFGHIVKISSAVIILSWLIFSGGGVLETSDAERIYFETILDEPLLVIDTFAHSVNVFFTGTGQFQPANRAGVLLMTVESAFGPVLLALLVFVFGRRAAR